MCFMLTLYFSCSHGLRNCREEEIIAYYGKSKEWPLFPTLKKKVYHGGKYK